MSNQVLEQGEYVQLDGVAIGDLVRKREVSPREMLNAAVMRADKVNPYLNAIVRRHDTIARELADVVDVEAGPLVGVPTLLKDLGARMAGVASRSASRFVPEMPADADNTVVAKMKLAGLLPFGVTNCSEFGLTPFCEPALYGPALNPRAPGLTPGGSSGGAAAAVAAGVVPFAHATDGGGSIRIPASACGLVGLKPSRGRISAAPEGDWANGVTVQGVVSRTVRDTAAALDALSGYVTGDPYVAPAAPTRGYLDCLRQSFARPLRIAVDTGPHDGAAMAPECVWAVDIAAHACEALGHDVTFDRPASVPAGEWDPQLRAAFHTIFAAAAGSSIGSWAKGFNKDPVAREFERLTWNYYCRSQTETAADYGQALWRLQYASREFASFFETYDVWLTPTLGTPPPVAGVLDSEAALASVDVPPARRFNPICPLYNMSGQPAITLPIATTADGIPIGAMFGAALGREDVLLRLAAALEEVASWTHPAARASGRDPACQREPVT